MSTASPQDVVRRAVEEAWNQHDLDAFDRLFASTYINRDPTDPGSTDLESLKRGAAELFAAFPDFRVTIRDLICEGDQVAKVWTVEGTQQGEIYGIAPSGRQVKFDGITIYRVVEGKVLECTWSMDNLGFLQQLGAIPMPDQAAAP